MPLVFISLGSNIGDGVQNCQRALEMISSETDGTDIRECSGFYLTSPVEIKDQEWFVNCAACVETELDPDKLLSFFKKIEAGFGRDFSAKRFGPRIIDIDILLYDGISIKTEDLEIPHPRMHERRFVLEPLNEIAPDSVHPDLGMTVSEMLIKVDGSDQVVMRIDEKIDICQSKISNK